MVLITLKMIENINDSNYGLIEDEVIMPSLLCMGDGLIFARKCI